MGEQKEADFESTLAELERVVEGLENGELSLAEQLKAFERGMELSEQCKKMLDEARLKVIELTENDNSEEIDEES
ncbi:MAG: exodeoxyribonuclease VII small subunit [Gammaproteobacteria bacterium]|nr:exodeoxyribonuclease VII small subunit [Gammaproteobacteria bacterium]